MLVLVHGKKPEEYPLLPAPANNERQLPSTGTDIDELLRALLQHDPSRRPPAYECILHPYFRASAVEDLRAAGELQDSRARLTLARSMLDQTRSTHGWRTSTTRAAISRENLLNDGLKLVAQLGESGFRGKLQITFRSAGVQEQGIDAGGLLSDFYSQLWAKVVEKLFQAGTTGGGYLPKPFPEQAARQGWSMTVVGRLLAKTIYDGRATGQPLGASLFKYLQGEAPSFRDLEAFDPENMRMLHWMLVTSPIEETFPTTFEDVSGGTDERSVTDANKQEYASLKCTQILVNDRLGELVALKDGFDRALALISPSLPNAFRALTASDLHLLACGEMVVLPVQVLAILRFRGFPAESQVERWLREIIGTKDSDWLKRFLKFVTSQPVLPRAPQSEHIHVDVAAHHGPDHLPSASTCFNQLHLPPYTSGEMLLDKLERALPTEGFGNG